MDNKSLFSRGVAEVIVREVLEKQLASGKKLRVKLGIDPSTPDLHLGHSVVLRKLRDFQNAGHTAVLIFGDFTGMIGDPSGRAGARQPLTQAQIKENLKEYLHQAGKVIDVDSVELHYNSEWFKKMDLDEKLKLEAQFTLQQLIQREDFAKRLAEGRPVGAHELSYPMMQAYDSVMVKADIELGGLDQKLNILAGRQLMEKMGLLPQNVMLVPLLEGTDGVKKMSKSLGNYIGLDEAPDEMFAKIMRAPDKLLPKYFELLTDVDMPLEQNPRDMKLALARIIVSMYHNDVVAEKAAKNFIAVFSRKEMPKTMPQIVALESELSVLDLIMEAGGAKSKSEARRLIEQGGIKVNDEVRRDEAELIEIQEGIVLQVGKRKFFKVIRK